MLLIGAGLLSVFAFIVWREYAAYLNRSLGELSAFLAFLSNMKERMECYLEGPSSWAADFSSNELERIGFLKGIREGGDLETAYANCAGSLCMSSEARSVLDELFLRLGGGYLDNELEAVNSALDKLSRIEDSEKSGRDNKIKAAGAMLGAIAVGAVILIL